MFAEVTSMLTPTLTMAAVFALLSGLISRPSLLRFGAGVILSLLSFALVIGVEDIGAEDDKFWPIMAVLGASYLVGSVIDFILSAISPKRPDGKQ